jgi:hypothetical protein
MARKNRQTKIWPADFPRINKTLFFKAKHYKNSNHRSKQKIKENEMYALIGMGVESQNIEIPCLIFETKQDAKGYLSQIPWLQCYDPSGVTTDDSAEDPIIYTMPTGLYEQTIPSAAVATLPQHIVNYAQQDITYGKAAGLHFFTYYNDRRKRIDYYTLMKVIPGAPFVGFDGRP